MSERRTEGGHDAKGAAPKEKSSAGKAMGYSDADPAEAVSGRDGLKPAAGAPGAKVAGA